MQNREKKIAVTVKKVSDQGLVCEDENGKKFAVMSSKLHMPVEEYSMGQNLILTWLNGGIVDSAVPDDTDYPLVGEIFATCTTVDNITQLEQNSHNENIPKMQRMHLNCKPILNGIMAYWNGLAEAARYVVTLYINDNDIATRINERSEKYCTFTGLADINGEKAISAKLMSAVYNAAHSSHYGSSAVTSINSGYEYYVQVQAEGRDGKIIGQSDKVQCSVNEL